MTTDHKTGEDAATRDRGQSDARKRSPMTFGEVMCVLYLVVPTAIAAGWAALHFSK